MDERARDRLVVDVDGGEDPGFRIEDARGRARSREFDVRDGGAVATVVDEPAAEHGLDLVVNNAGVGHPGAPIEEVTAEVRDVVVDTNALGVWNGCHAAGPHLKESGAMVNVASVAGLAGFPTQAAYSLSKGGW